MVAEWIDGVRLSDTNGIRRLVGEEEPLTESAESTPTPLLVSRQQPLASFEFPAKPLKGGTQYIMHTMVSLFSAQMFDWGWVHCDPHPGNVIIRPSPTSPTQPQLVLIDHGLYVQTPEGFKREWINLWRGMLSGDYSQVEKVTKNWGLAIPDLLASFALMRPTVLRRNREKRVKIDEGQSQQEERPLTHYEMSVRMKKKLKEFLTDTDRMPKVLIFLTRNMRMVQGMITHLSLLCFGLHALILGNNQSLGSPVNRIKLTGYWASKSQTRNPNLALGQRIKEWWSHIVFRSVMFSLDVIFWKTKFMTWLGDVKCRLLGGDVSSLRKQNFEQEVERSILEFAQENLGFQNKTTFEG